MSKVITGDKNENGEKSILSRIISSFLFRLFFALLLAVVVWLTINTTSINPPAQKTISTTLNLLNRGVLDSRNIELRTEAFRQVNIYLIGRQEEIDRITPGDFEAFIDFNNVLSVEDTSLDVELRTMGSENVTVLRIEPATVPIMLEMRKTKIMDINIQFTGELADGLILTNFSRFPATKSFTARESLIDQIDRVEVEVDLSGISGNTILHQQSRIFNNEDRLMNQVGWEQVVDISLEISKDVPVIPNVTGSPAEDHYVRYVTISPEVVRINGTKEALEQVDSLYADSLDIGFSRQSIAMERSILMPNNIKLTSNMLPRALIDVTIFKYLYTQDITLSKARIELININDQYRYEIMESEIPLLLKGRVDDINNLDSSQISAVIDVGRLASGTHAVSTIVTLPEGIVNVNDVLVNVIVARNQ